MSISGPSPLGTLMVQRVEAALGNTISQQANLATGARPDAVTQPGQPDKVDPAKNPPPKGHEGSRRANDQGGRQALGALARNDPEIARLLAARNAPMTAYTASAPTSLGNAAKAILALFQQFPDARPAVSGRAPLLASPPGQADARAVQALIPQTQSGAQPGVRETSAGSNAAGTAGPVRSGAAHASPAASTTGGSPSASSAAPGAPASGSTPSVTPGMAGQLALALSHALQSSGLFYEAHLREFAFGRRTLTQMKAEPQAQVGRESSPSSGAEAGTRAGGEPGATSAQAAGQQSQAAQSAQAGTQPGAQGHAQSSAQLAGAQTNAQLAGALLGLDPSTHALVRQQLETLATQSFAWQGEAWPGSDLEWEVQRRDARDGEGAQTDSWATRLKLQLPGLGEVQARLSLAGTQLVLHLASPEGADLMTSHSEVLRDRLLGHGLHLSQLSISQHADDDGRSLQHTDGLTHAGDAPAHTGDTPTRMADTPKYKGDAATQTDEGPAT